MLKILFSIDIVCEHTRHPTFNILLDLKQFKQFSNTKPINFNFHFYMQQDLKCYNKKAVQVVPLVKGLKEKDKRIGKTRKTGKEGEKKMVCQ